MAALGVDTGAPHSEASPPGQPECDLAGVALRRTASCPASAECVVTRRASGAPRAPIGGEPGSCSAPRAPTPQPSAEEADLDAVRRARIARF